MLTRWHRQTGLAALLEDKSIVEKRAAEAEQRLAEACTLARACEVKIRTLQQDLGLAHARAVAVTQAHAHEYKGAADAQAHTKQEASEAAERVAALEHSLLETNQALKESNAEVEVLRCELERVRAEEGEALKRAIEGGRAARAKALELEEAARKRDRDHALFREKLEAKLELLKAAFEEEEQEDGSQVRFSPLPPSI